jgi:hypothetical protein
MLTLLDVLRAIYSRHPPLKAATSTHGSLLAADAAAAAPAAAAATPPLHAQHHCVAADTTNCTLDVHCCAPARQIRVCTAPAQVHASERRIHPACRATEVGRQGAAAGTPAPRRAADGRATMQNNTANAAQTPQQLATAHISGMRRGGVTLPAAAQKEPGRKGCVPSVFCSCQSLPLVS